MRSRPVGVGGQGWANITPILLWAGGGAALKRAHLTPSDQLGSWMFMNLALTALPVLPHSCPSLPLPDPALPWRQTQ